MERPSINVLDMLESYGVPLYTGCVTGNGRFLNGCYGAGRGGRGLGRGQLNSSGHAVSVASYRSGR
jgi:hypothetical protein